jgi:HEAT repeat protein
MPIVLEVHYTDGTKDSIRAVISEKSTTVTIANPKGKKIDYTLFDPSYNVLHTLTTSKSYNEWLAQATKAHSMIDRLDAVLALKDTAMERKRGDLIILFNKEKSYNVRAEIITQFKLDTSEQAITLLKKALQDEHYLVRRAVIDQVLYIPTGIVYDCERLLADTSYFTIENTLRKLCKQYPANKERYLATTKNTIGISKNVRIAWLEINAETNPEESRNELIGYTSHSYEFRTRVKAMEALERINYSNEALIKNLFDAILNPNTRLAGPADRVLHKLMAKAEVKEIAKTYYQSNTWKDWQDERLKKLFE